MRDKMTKYMAVLIDRNGDVVTDFEENTIEKIHQDFNDFGGSWLFYPYVFIIKKPKGYAMKDLAKQKILDVVALEKLDFMKGWTVSRAIKKIVTENAKLKKGEPLWGL